MQAHACLSMHGFSLERQLNDLKEREKKKLSWRDRRNNKIRLRRVHSAMHNKWLQDNHKDILATQKILGNIGVLLFMTTVVIVSLLFIVSGLIPSVNIMSGGTISGLTILGLLVLLNRCV